MEKTENFMGPKGEGSWRRFYRAGQRMRSENRVETSWPLAIKNAFFTEQKGQTSNYGEKLESMDREQK